MRFANKVAIVCGMMLLISAMGSPIEKQKRPSPPPSRVQDSTAVKDFVPEPDRFVPLEIYPEMIYEEQPVYPAGLSEKDFEGTVWIKSHLDTTGIPVKVMVYKSSRIAAIDSAAVQTGYKCRFKPGMNRGKPVMVWVSSPVTFGKLAKKPGR